MKGNCTENCTLQKKIIEAKTIFYDESSVTKYINNYINNNSNVS